MDTIFLDEVGAFERAGVMAITATRHEIQTDPKKRFRVFVNATALSLSADKILPMTRRDVDVINAAAEKIEAPEYKNPLGFVLGYFVARKGSSFADQLKYINSRIDTISSDRLVKTVDAVRYGRMWQRLR